VKAWRALGIFAVALAAFCAEERPPLELPPLLASEGARPWRYVATADFQVLSRCTDELTLKFIQREQRLEELARLIVPVEFRPRRSLSRMFVLTDEAGLTPRAGDSAGRHLTDLPLEDVDVQVRFVALGEGSFAGESLAFDRRQLLRSLQRQAPPLPEWLLEGISTLLADMDFQTPGILVAPLIWISEPVTQRVSAEADFPRTMLALGEVFAPRAAGAKPDPELNALRRSEVALLCRWALDGKDSPSRAALWKFAGRVGTERPTEALIQECFGMSSSDLRDRLSDYLPVAVKRGMRLPLADREADAAPTLRDATALEIARIRGEWERLTVGYVRARQAELALQYLAHARDILLRGAEASTSEKSGASDPAEETPATTKAPDARISALLGLLELEAGRPTEARPHLEAAVRGNVVGPRVYAEVARLRFLEARAKPEGASGLLSATQANTILAPLATARTQSPPLPQTYLLAAQTWFYSGLPLEPANLVLLEEGLRFFPQEQSLLFQVALLRASRGEKSEAAALVKRALAAELTSANRAAFERLRASLEK
jgi:hypothetical protein